MLKQIFPFPPKYLWIFSLLLSALYPTASFAQTLEKEPVRKNTHQPDWLLDASPYTAGIYRGNHPDEIVMSNGLIRRTFRMSPNAATVGFDNLITGESILRGVKPEAEITINGDTFAVGGLTGQPNYAFLLPEWIDSMKADSRAMQITGFKTGKATAPFEWKEARHHAPHTAWPPKGVHLQMDYELPAYIQVQARVIPNITVSVHYELYDGIPVMAKWITLTNHGGMPVTVNSFTSEILAAVEYGSSVETRQYNVLYPNIHVETDFAFASMYSMDANHHVVHWESDPDYATQVSYLRVTPCLLKVKPEIGPEEVVLAGDQFTSFRTYIMPHDSYDRERQGLAQRRLYRTLAPWSTENPLMMHARFADWERVKVAIDQCAEVGFEMVILTFGSGFNIEDDSPAYMEKMKEYADYAKSKGVEIGGYSLLASRKIDEKNDVVMPEGQTPTFGNSPCIGSEWGQTYFKKLYNFYEKTGFALLEHDGSYPGDVCISTNHPGHTGYHDSQWKQYQVISDFYKWCRSKGIYLNIPDYYYLAGGNKCGMGYREVNWSLPRDQQVIHTRQNIYDGTWTKLSTMGWMFVPLTEYQGGGDAATIEPLSDHLDHYEKMIISNLGAGVQACYRGPRLYDTEATKQMVKQSVDWYKQHREVLEGDLIHLRRADGRDIDYWLMVNPEGKEKAALVVFNPTKEDVSRSIAVPLYYAGLKGKVKAMCENKPAGVFEANQGGEIALPVKVGAGKWVAYFLE
ncbi:MAG: alpha-galactosidase [Bacteroidia bacterium]